MQNNKDWLNLLKAGDKVIVSSTYSNKLSTVEKITPKGFIKVDGKLFGQNGMQKGVTSRFDIPSRLEEATTISIQEILDKITVRKALDMMKNVSKLTVEQANKIIDIIK